MIYYQNSLKSFCKLYSDCPVYAFQNQGYGEIGDGLRRRVMKTYITEKTPQVTDTLTVWYLIENFVLNKGYASYSLGILFHTDEFAET